MRASRPISSAQRSSSEILAEAVAPVHLEREPAEVAEPLLAQPQERAALAAQLAGGGVGRRRGRLWP